MNRVVSEKIPVDNAVDELIARIKQGCGLRLTSPSPRSCGERVGVRGWLHERNSRRVPLTRSLRLRPLPASGARLRVTAKRVRTMGDHTLSIRYPQPAAVGAAVDDRRSGASCCWRPICWCSWPSWSTRSATGCGWRGIRPAMSRSITTRSSARAAVNTLIFLVIGNQFKMLVALFPVLLLSRSSAPGSNGCRCCSSCPGRCRRSRPFSPCASCSIRNGASSTR